MALLRRPRLLFRPFSYPTSWGGCPRSSPSPQFSPPARAEALLRYNLPPRLVAAVDWATLRRESGLLVDWERETRKDLLFSARYLHTPPEAPPHFFLIEHQAPMYRFMALRLLTYGERYIRLWHEAHPQSL